MTIKEFLNSYQDSKNKLKYLTEEIQGLSKAIIRTTPVYGSETVKHSRNIDQLPEVIEYLDELQQQYKQETKQAISTMKSVQASILAIPDAKASRALFLHYILGQQYKEIAFEMQISTRTVGTLIQRGERQIKIPDKQ